MHPAWDNFPGSLYTGDTECFHEMLTTASKYLHAHSRPSLLSWRGPYCEGTVFPTLQPCYPRAFQPGSCKDNAQELISPGARAPCPSSASVTPGLMFWLWSPSLYCTPHSISKIPPTPFFKIIFLSGWTTRHVGSGPQQEIESTPRPQHWKGSLNHWATREVPWRFLSVPFAGRAVWDPTHHNILDGLSVSAPPPPTLSTAHGRSGGAHALPPALPYGANSGPDGNRRSAENKG